MQATAFPVAIPTPLRSYTGGAAEVTVRVTAAAPTLADVFAALDAAYPGIRFRMVDEAGRVRPHVQVFVDAVDRAQSPRGARPRRRGSCWWVRSPAVSKRSH